MKDYVIRVSIPQTYNVKANSEEEAIAAIRNTLQPNLQSAAQFIVVKDVIIEDSSVQETKEKE